jgi:hypothetical protein
VVPLGAEEDHAALEEPELHAVLDGQREVMEGERLEGGEKVPRPPGPAVLGCHRQRTQAILRQFAQPTENDLAVLMVREPIDVSKARIGEPLADEVPNPDFGAVEQRLERRDVDPR